MKKTWYLVLFVILFLFPSGLSAVDCPVETTHAYKTSRDSAVWYVSEECTKKSFKNSELFFSYFTSWNDVEVNDNITQVRTDSVPWMAWGPKYNPGNGAVVKTLDDPKVYFLIAGKKYWIESEEAFTNKSYQWNWVEDVSPALLEKYDMGHEITEDDSHPPYALIKQEGDSKVYRIEPDRDDRSYLVKRHIASEKVFNSLGYRWDRIIEIPKDIPAFDDTKDPFSDSVFDKVPDGEPIMNIQDTYTISLPHLYKLTLEDFDIRSINLDGLEAKGLNVRKEVVSEDGSVHITLDVGINHTKLNGYRYPTIRLVNGNGGSYTLSHLRHNDSISIPDILHARNAVLEAIPVGITLEEVLTTLEESRAIQILEDMNHAYEESFGIDKTELSGLHNMIITHMGLYNPLIGLPDTTYTRTGSGETPAIYSSYRYETLQGSGNFMYTEAVLFTGNNGDLYLLQYNGDEHVLDTLEIIVESIIYSK